MRDRSAFRALATLPDSVHRVHCQEEESSPEPRPCRSRPCCWADPRPATRQTKPVPHLSIMRPSSAPPDSSQRRRPLSQMMVQPNLTPVNTGPGIVFTCDPSVATATCNYLKHDRRRLLQRHVHKCKRQHLYSVRQHGSRSELQAENFVTYSQYCDGLRQRRKQERDSGGGPVGTLHL